MMKRTLIRYRTKPELADQNAALIAAVFAELKAAKPEGVRYLSLRLDDGTFVHFVETAPDAAGVLQNSRPSRHFRAVFASVASSRRSPEVLPSSAIIACSMSRKPFEGDAMTVVPDSSDSRESRGSAADLDGLFARMRPKLHRYCARMTGSVIDGEDVLQDALIKAVESLAAAGPIGNPEGWLFRIAHNTALDFLRRRHRHGTLRSAEEIEMVATRWMPLSAARSRAPAFAPSCDCRSPSVRASS